MGYIFFILGIIAGLATAGLYLTLTSATGVLRIDRSNPNKDRYRFDIDDIDILNRKKRVLLSIDTNADLSQE